MTRARRTRALIVDDEPLARDLLHRTLAEAPGLEIVGECGSGAEAVEAIDDLVPDLVFLDIRMPELGGFDVIERVGPDRMPEVVFVTAHEEHTLRAFQVHALDYVVKPYDPERILEAARHARTRVLAGRPSHLGERLESLLGELGVAGPGRPVRPARRLTVRDGDRIRFVDVDAIDWLEADDKQVRVHAGRDTHEVRISLSALVEALDPTRFVRIHRSAAVHLNRVEEVQPWGHGDHVAILSSGTQLRVSRTYSDELLRLVH